MYLGWVTAHVQCYVVCMPCSHIAPYNIIAPHDLQVRGHVELFLCACKPYYVCGMALTNSCMFCACGFCHVEFYSRAPYNNYCVIGPHDLQVRGHVVFWDDHIALHRVSCMWDGTPIAPYNINVSCSSS